MPMLHINFRVLHPASQRLLGDVQVAGEVGDLLTAGPHLFYHFRLEPRQVSSSGRISDYPVSPPPTEMRRPRSTRAFKLRSQSTRRARAASASTPIVSWKPAAARNESLASTARITRRSVARDVAARWPLALAAASLRRDPPSRPTGRGGMPYPRRPRPSPTRSSGARSARCAADPTRLLTRDSLARSPVPDTPRRRRDQPAPAVRADRSGRPM